MSERIVTSIPKGLSDSTMRGSRESLRSSRESLRESRESLLAAATSIESLPTSSRIDLTCADGTMKFKQNQIPQRKFLKKVLNLRTGRGNLSSVPSMDESKCFQTESTSRISVTPQSMLEKSVAHCKETRIVMVTSVSDGNAIQELTTHECKPAMSGDDTALGATAVRDRSLALVMHEMIETEQRYIDSLRYVIQNYIPELRRDDLIQTLQGKKAVIFGNLEKIYEFHVQSFLEELKKCANIPLSVGNVFLRHASDFYLYTLYSKNKPKCDSLMAECGMLFFKKKQYELQDQMDLSSYLLKPIQRMGMYALLLEQILKECDEKDPNHHSLKDALELVKFELRQGNDLLAMDCIRNCDINLQDQGLLLRQDEFLVCHGSRKCLRRIFLFEELILFCKTKRHASTDDYYVYKNSFKTSEIGITENLPTDSKPQFEIWFRKRVPKFTYILQAGSAKIRQAWIGEIARILWKQAIKHRESSLAATLYMETTRKETFSSNPLNENDMLVTTSTDPWVRHLEPKVRSPEKNKSSRNKTPVTALNSQGNVNCSDSNTTITEEKDEELDVDVPTVYDHSLKAKQNKFHKDSIVLLSSFDHLPSTDV